MPIIKNIDLQPQQMPKMNKKPPKTFVTQKMLPRLLNDRYELQHLISETTLATFFEASDLRDANNEEKHLIIAAAEPSLVACNGFTLLWERVLAEFTRPDSPLNIIDTCQSDGIYWIIFNQQRGEMLSEHLRHRVVTEHTLSVVQAQLLQLLRASKQIMPQGGFGFLEPGAIWRSHNQCQLLNAPLVIILHLLLKLENDRREPLALQSAYLSPEVARGIHPTAQDDTFSIGCITHHLLQGYPPFHPQNSLEAFQLNKQPPALASLKTETRNSLQRALSWQRYMRQPSPYELVHAFTEIPPDIEKSQHPPLGFFRKTRAVVVALAGFIALSTYFLPKKTPQTTQAAQTQTIQVTPSATPIAITLVATPVVPAKMQTTTRHIIKEEKIVSKAATAIKEKQTKPPTKIRPEKNKQVQTTQVELVQQTETLPIIEPSIPEAPLATAPTQIPTPPMPVKKAIPATPIKPANIRVIQTGKNTFVVAADD